MPAMQLLINHPDDQQLFQQVIADYCQTWSTDPNQDHPDWHTVYNHLR